VKRLHFQLLHRILVTVVLKSSMIIFVCEEIIHFHNDSTKKAGAQIARCRFCCRNLDFGMTWKLECDLYNLSMYLYSKNEVARLKHPRVRSRNEEKTTYLAKSKVKVK